jgi:hypothetical protein
MHSRYPREKFPIFGFVLDTDRHRRDGGKRGVASTTDIDRLDLIQGFFDLRLPSPLGDAPVVQRLIAVREEPNVWRDSDGVRITGHWGGVTIHPRAVARFSCRR